MLARGAIRAARSGLLAVALLFCACTEPTDGAAATDAFRIFGGPGAGRGQFVSPRGISAAGGRVWVVDRSGRVQVFTSDGEWTAGFRVVDGSKGYPIGITALGERRAILTDTHNSAVRRIHSDGGEDLRFGTFGSAEGSFHYPQRTAVDAQGNLYITEYGEDRSNRVQVFTAEGKFLRSFGEYGNGPGQFTRVIGIALKDDEVFLADTSDRIIVYSTGGTYRREWGRSGSGPGELRYPYGLCFLAGLLYVCEYGGHRIQRFTTAGEPRGYFGRAGKGDEPGEFSGPWDLCAYKGRLYICDTGNHRIVILDPDRVEWRLR